MRPASKAKAKAKAKEVIYYTKFLCKKTVDNPCFKNVYKIY